MSYRFRTWGRAQVQEVRDFFEKAYRRQTLPAWDVKWHALSAQARYFFLHEVKGPLEQQYGPSQQPSASAEKFPHHILEELTHAGFVAVQGGLSRAFDGSVVANKDTYDFAVRVRAAQRFRLLAAELPNAFTQYVDYTFYDLQLLRVILEVLHQGGISDYPVVQDALARYVTSRYWPHWVVRALHDPVAGRVLDVLQSAKGPLPLQELLGQVKGVGPNVVRAAVDKLVTHLALVEDLQPHTWELMVGLLPTVREAIQRASQPRQRPPLVVVEQPSEIGPDSSVIVDDLRAVLLEVVSDPPQIRQDEALFHKERSRFQALLGPMTTWLLDALGWAEEQRLSRAFCWARGLGLVKDEIDGKQTRLHPTPEGHRWLSGGTDEQYTRAYGFLTKPVNRHDMFDPNVAWLYAGLDFFQPGGLGDVRFLGEPISVFEIPKGKRPPSYWENSPADQKSLRDALDRAFTALQPGVFCRLDSVVAHLAFAEHNPLHRGLAPDRVVVYWGGREVPPLEEQREEAGRRLIDSFVRKRLIPLGCVRTAIDGEGRLAIARQPRCAAYFGHLVRPDELAPAASAEPRVVVQPDFSVIVIGPNPAPAADLAPFCERAAASGSQGALVLKITRASVIKAVSLGLRPKEIVGRLERHASKEVPANVLREVQEWSQWVRHVTPTTITVLRCPDQDTADRVMEALKRQGERINETLVGIAQKRVTAAERNKLRAYGILVQGHSEAEESKPKKRKQR